MKAVLKIIASVLLLVNGIGALWGGTNLLRDTSGKSMGWSLNMLAHTPFSDYFVPGLILFVANGLFSLFVFLLLLFNNRKYPLFILAQGAILVGWIVIQVMMLRTIVPLHLVMLLVGVILVVCGWRLNHERYEVK